MGLMPAKFLISDMHLFSLQRTEGGTVLLRESDHMLRRFGQLEILDLLAGEKTEFTLRAEADRFVFVISGRCEIKLIDLREHSPSMGVRTRLALDAENPKGLLVPFGVACSMGAVTAARLVHLSTHSDAHANDRVVTPDNLQEYVATE